MATAKRNFNIVRMPVDPSKKLGKTLKTTRAIVGTGKLPGRWMEEYAQVVLLEPKPIGKGPKASKVKSASKKKSSKTKVKYDYLTDAEKEQFRFLMSKGDGSTKGELEALVVSRHLGFALKRMDSLSRLQKSKMSKNIERTYGVSWKSADKITAYLADKAIARVRIKAK